MLDFCLLNLPKSKNGDGIDSNATISVKFLQCIIIFIFDIRTS